MSSSHSRGCLASFILLVTTGFQIHKVSVPRALSSAGMPAAPKRADAPITAADAAMAEHVLREKFEEYRKTFKQQAFDIVVDTFFLTDLVLSFRTAYPKYDGPYTYIYQLYLKYL